MKNLKQISFNYLKFSFFLIIFTMFCKDVLQLIIIAPLKLMIKPLPKLILKKE